MKNRILLTGLFVLTVQISMAQFNGRPDSTFGANGVALFDHYGFDQTIGNGSWADGWFLYQAEN